MPTNIEIERKFVVNPIHPEWIKIKNSTKWKRLIQATIHKEEWYKLRVRMIEDLDIGDQSSFLCFKVSKKWVAHDPAIRDEYEWAVNDRFALYTMIGHGEVSKIRRTWTDTTGLIWEIDEYEWLNAGIITADVELDSVNHSFIKPDFLWWEVTSDQRLKNSSLQEIEKAFSTWTNEEKKWYESLFEGNGNSIYPTNSIVFHTKKYPIYTRIKKAWKILIGSEELI